MAEVNSEKYPSLPSNYVSIVQLQERWLLKKEQEKKEKQETPLHQNQEKVEEDRSVHKTSRVHVESGKEKPQNHSKNVQKGKEPVIEASVDGKRENFKKNKKKGYFGKRKNRAKEEIMTVVSVENGERELCKGDQLNKEVKQEGGPVIHRVSNLVPVASGILSKNKEVKEGGGPIINRVSNYVSLAPGMSQLSKNKELKEEPLIDQVSNGVPLSGNSRLSKDKEVGRVVEGSKVDREIPLQKRRVGFRVKKDGRRMMGGKFGEVGDKADNVEQSRHDLDAEEKEVSVNVNERANEKGRVRGAFRENDDTTGDVTGNAASISNIDMAEGGIMPVMERGGKELSKGRYQLKNKNKEIKEVGTVYMVEVAGENKADKENVGQRSKAGYRGKKDSRRMVGGKFRKAGVKADSVEQSGQENNAEMEVVSDNVKERTNEKVRVRGAFCENNDKRRDVTGNVASVSTIDLVEEEIMTVVESSGKEISKGRYQLLSENKEIKEVGTVYMVEVVEENKVGKEIPVQRSRVGFRVKKDSRRMVGIKVGEVGDKADSVEQSRQENCVKEEKISVDVKERTDEDVGVRGGNGYRDTRGDVSLVESENIKIESNFGNLSLSGKRCGYGKSSVRVHGNKWRYGSSRRYEPRKQQKPRDSSFVWVKKAESSHGNDAEIETQVDSSSQSPSQS